MNLKENYKFLLAVLILLFPIVDTAKACDICGSGAGSYYQGIIPDFNKRFIGMRYQYNTIHTHLGSQGEKTIISHQERYQTSELWGAWSFGKKWRVMGFIPYSFNYRKMHGTGETGKKNGLGDILLMGYYRILDLRHTTDKKNKMIIHSLWGGAGIKLPTGKYKDSDRTAAMNAPNNFQLGTASTDFLINLAYDFRVMDGGFNTNISYKINTENRYEYRYGNKFTANLLGYYKFAPDSSKVRIAPNFGGMIEVQSKDVIYNRFDVATSGGYTLSAVAGIELNINKISFGGNFQQPVVQHLAEKRAKAGSRFLVHISYAF